MINARPSIGKYFTGVARSRWCVTVPVGVQVALLLTLSSPLPCGYCDIAEETDMDQGYCYMDSCSKRVADYKAGVLKDGEKPKDLSDKEWEQRLSPEQYRVMREHGTERAFTGKWYDHHEKGVYICPGCGAELFESSNKYESGSGWPSFYQAKGAEGTDDTKSNVTRKYDDSHGMQRIEVLCKKCSAHLGHVFPDGPEPTGLRYCINSASLDFKPSQ